MYINGGSNVFGLLLRFVASSDYKQKYKKASKNVAVEHNRLQSTHLVPKRCHACINWIYFMFVQINRECQLVVTFFSCF